MNALSKGLLGLGAMPLTLLGSFAVFPVFDAPSQGNWIVAGTVAAAGALGAWFIEWTERKVVANRVVIDLKPNQVIVDGVPIDCPFSSMTHFFRSRGALAEAVGIAVNEAMLKQEKFLVARKSALIRIWPGSFQVTDFELEALSEAMTAEFISPAFELMGQPMAPQENRNLPSAPAVNR
ncbi:hypothetical protein HBO38_34335 [Pseudomonas veronii]|uniref:Uncharacterized protein n=1 Tax=Pseudomonas veronii TaxID=76761 RepID=A0A7Y1ACT8_PSEVE|nr:hypothetical protein [Pseudomonas veronii]NMY13415.1 hypothetical protein [Pseudomonas veronii]